MEYEPSKSESSSSFPLENFGDFNEQLMYKVGVRFENRPVPLALEGRAYELKQKLSIAVEENPGWGKVTGIDVVEASE